MEIQKCNYEVALAVTREKGSGYRLIVPQVSTRWAAVREGTTRLSVHDKRFWGPGTSVERRRIATKSLGQ